jgi:hypothetical protein
MASQPRSWGRSGVVFGGGRRIQSNVFEFGRMNPAIISTYHQDLESLEPTRRVSTVIFHTTNAPILVLRSFTTTWSSMYTLFAQQALFLASSPSVLSCSVIAPSGIDSTDILETDLWCDETQYGGLDTGDVTGELTTFC